MRYELLTDEIISDNSSAAFLSVPIDKTKINKHKYMNKHNEPIPGDVLGVNRGLYQHYSVYIGNDRVIHYAGKDNDMDDCITIHEAPMSEFLNGSDYFFVVDFPDTDYQIPTTLMCAGGLLFNTIKTIMNNLKFHLYSREETIERAKSRLGEKEYNLVTNNCEHFAIWCKTGVSESSQVDKVLQLIEIYTFGVVE